MGIARTLVRIALVALMWSTPIEASPRDPDSSVSARAPKKKKRASVKKATRKARVKKARVAKKSKKRAVAPKPAPIDEPTEVELAAATTTPETEVPAPEPAAPATAVIDTQVAEPVTIEKTSSSPEPLIGLSTSVTGTAQLQDADQKTMLAVASFGYTRASGTSIVAKVGWVHDSAAHGSGVSNVLLGASVPFSLGAGFGLELRVVGIAPIGTGGGDDAKPAALSASLAGTDWGGPMFAPNHVSGAPAMRLVYGRGRFFVLADSAFYYAKRVRGEMVDPLGKTVMFQSSKAVLGVSFLSVFTMYGGAAQTHYWGHPEFLGDNPGASRDDHYAFGGLDFAKRFTGSQFRLGVLYGRAIDAPKLDRKFQVAEVTTGFDF